MKNDSFELADCNSSRAKSSNNNHGTKLIWRNVSVFAKTDVNTFLRKKTQRKRIINNSTGCVKPGVLLAVMGARYSQMWCEFSKRVWSIFVWILQWRWQKYVDVSIGPSQSGRYHCQRWYTRERSTSRTIYASIERFCASGRSVQWGVNGFGAHNIHGMHQIRKGSYPLNKIHFSFVRQICDWTGALQSRRSSN